MEHNPKATSISDVEIRTELQGLRRLPRTGAILFTVRTYMNPLTDLAEEPEALNNLWDSVRNFPEPIAAYKVKDLWIDVFEQYCQQVLGRQAPEPAKPQDGMVANGVANNLTPPPTPPA